MAKKKISGLPAGSALNGTELVPIVQTGTTKRITTQDIANLGNASGVEGSGTINNLAKFTASSTIGNSIFSASSTIGYVSGNFQIDNTTPLATFNATEASVLHGLEFKQLNNLDAFIKQLPATGEFRISNGRSVGWGGFTTFYTDTIERMRLDYNGKLGLGVTPSANWDISFKALQIGIGTVLYNNTSANGTFLGSNFFYNGTDNKYIANGTATGYGQINGTHNWFTATSGTAGNSVTFTTAMSLNASSNLSVLGSVTASDAILSNLKPSLNFTLSVNPAFSHSIVGENYSSGAAANNYMDLKVANAANTQQLVLRLFGDGTSTFTGNITTTAGGVNYGGANTYVFGDNSDLYLGTNGNSRIKINSTGNVLINTSTDVASSKLTIDSTTQGVLVPRMTETQINNINLPATGLLVYNTSQNHMCMFDGSVWKKFSMSNM